MVATTACLNDDALRSAYEGIPFCLLHTTDRQICQLGVCHPVGVLVAS